ncbi:hypothetical protein TRFO_33699 [Tritrichomonas foetus]|uniref:Uncharacterized protein n=1 Tax=Tritrichomonas foetus TaxID=1144522 RepID=A0A1J4JR89_9EUKA|nr:hypothetical protein TRFO_33699 [Tritrichomonas foetus]|eukprot:OHS99780.1 hypothetical protein TRFO_33699 [Tritrichomonas foetus]
MNGGVCQLVPTNSNDWAAELEMAFHGDTIVFTYGKQLCPNVTSRFFNAFNLSFTPITDRKQVRVHLSGPEVFPFADCNFDYNFYPEKVRIRIEKQNKNLTVSTITNTGMEKKCFTQKLSDFYNFGYLSLFSFTPENCEHCITNLLSLSFFPLSKNIEKIDLSIIERNRKYLEESKAARQMIKMMRRSKMLTISKYMDEISNYDGHIPENENSNNNDKKLNNNDFSDSLLETKELILRAKESISAENLSFFINYKMMPVIDKAAARFERVSDALWQMKTEMLDLWEDSSKALKNMNFDIRSDCEKLKMEVFGAAKQMKYFLNEVKHDDDDEAEKLDKGMSALIQKLLFFICAIEFIAYVLFFIRYHRTTIKKHM